MRLIDADTLIKNLSYLYTKNHIPVDMRAKEILTTIMEQPTAYSVDKVVEEIKTLKEEALGEYNMGEYNLDNNIGNSISENYRKDMNEGKCFAYDEAIEIVKQGGISDASDNVCEWKSTQINNEWNPSCEPNSTYNVFGVAWFKRCPYCGKKIKIKVVE